MSNDQKDEQEASFADIAGDDDLPAMSNDKPASIHPALEEKRSEPKPHYMQQYEQLLEIGRNTNIRDVLTAESLGEILQVKEQLKVLHAGVNALDDTLKGHIDEYVKAAVTAKTDMLFRDKIEQLTLSSVTFSAVCEASSRRVEQSAIEAMGKIAKTQGGLIDDTSTYIPVVDFKTWAAKMAGWIVMIAVITLAAHFLLTGR